MSTSTLRVPHNFTQFYSTHGSTYSTLKIKSAISIPKLPNRKQLLKELNLSKTFLKNNSITIPLENNGITPYEIRKDNITTTTDKLHVILEVILDRIEMHQNIGQQRENWNSLLLNSLNMITLSATTMAALAAADPSALALKVSATLLFTAATGILLIMNKIQPSQLVEEQRNAVRLFKQLQTRIQTGFITRKTRLTEDDVEEAMEKVLAIDKAYPLPLLGAMLDKFPNTFKPATWWPTSSKKEKNINLIKKKEIMNNNNNNNNGWSEELEEEMREIVGVIKKKDMEDYVGLGNKALKLNKLLAISGPLLTAIAAVGSGFVGHGAQWAGLVAGVAGSMASMVNTVEHGGQVGMVFEMYRNCGGFFSLLEETVESNLEEGDLGKRENGELFEMKMALHLGRSLTELRDFAHHSSTSSSSGGGCVNEFASKLF